MKCWRYNAAVPAMAGQEWLVPEEAVYHCCPGGKNLLGEIPPLPPPPVQLARTTPLPVRPGLAAFWGAPPEVCVPGPMMSGFLRWSVVGPRLEKEMMSLALFAPLSLMPEPPVPPNGLTSSPAPTVITF